MIQTKTETRYIDTAEGAKMLRAALKTKFPGVKFTVRISRYAGGSSTDVRWMDGPLTKQVEEVAKPYAGSGFDGMIDLKYSVDSWLEADGTVSFAKTKGTGGSMGSVPSDQTIPPSAKAVRVRFSNDYIFCTRTYSPAMYRRALERVCLDWGVPVDDVEIRISTYDGTPSVAGSLRVEGGKGEYLSTLIYRDLCKRTNYLVRA